MSSSSGWAWGTGRPPTPPTNCRTHQGAECPLGTGTGDNPTFVFGTGGRSHFVPLTVCPTPVWDRAQTVPVFGTRALGWGGDVRWLTFDRPRLSVGQNGTVPLSHSCQHVHFWFILDPKVYVLMSLVVTTQTRVRAVVIINGCRPRRGSRVGGWTTYPRGTLVPSRGRLGGARKRPHRR